MTRFSATVSISKKQLKTGNSKNCNSEVYSQSSPAGWLESQFLYSCQNLAEMLQIEVKNQPKRYCDKLAQLRFLDKVVKYDLQWCA